MKRREFRNIYDIRIVLRFSPTRPKKTQYTAAKMVKGIDANRAPNFPVNLS